MSRYGIIQARWFDLDGFGAEEAGLIAALSTFANASGWSWPSRQKLAEMLGKSPRWVSERMAYLETLGLIERQSRYREDGSQTSNAYRICEDAMILPPPLQDGATGVEAGFNPINTPIEHTVANATVTTKDARGCRLPLDWLPSMELVAWATANAPNFTSMELARVTEAFRDYWRAQPGQKGVKSDWDATWRNWIRREHEQRSGRMASAKPARSAAGTAEERAAALAEAAANYARKRATVRSF